MKTVPKILVIDDERFVRLVLDKALSAEGYSVVCVESGEAALELAKHEKFNLVITDLNMPGKNGIETILELKGMQSNLKIIAMSGGAIKGDGDYLPLAATLGAKHTLAKPFRKEDLTTIVAEEIGRPAVMPAA